jgi:membrane protease YdiL (CAAX protease family)
MRKALLAVALFAVLQTPFAEFVSPGSDAVSQMHREIIFWLVTLLLWAYVLVFEKRPLSSIGLVRGGWKDVLLGLATGAVTVAGFVVLYLYIVPALQTADAGAINEVQSYPLWLQLAICARAAAFEETLYRGLAIERMTELLRVRWLAALISLIVFTWRHLGSWGYLHLVVAGFGGVMLTALYLWRRNLVSNMIAHFVMDAVGFLIA